MRYGSIRLMSRLLLLSMGISMSGCTTPRTLHGYSYQETTVRDKTIDARTEHHKAALVNVKLGLSYLFEGQIARAKSKLTHALQLAPARAEPHSAMAYFLEQVNDNAEAESMYKRAIQLARHKGAVYNNYGTFLYRQRRFKEADQAFSLALKDKAYPHTAEVYENAGLCAAANGNNALSRAYYTKAIQHDPQKKHHLKSKLDQV
jgi:type IV pilus assembly protein PilF